MGNVIEVVNIRESIRDMVKIYRPSSAAKAAREYIRKYHIPKGNHLEIEKWFAEEIEKLATSQSESAQD